MMNIADVIFEQTYRFDELTIDLDQLSRDLGYEFDDLPEPFAGYLEQVVDDCRHLTDICGTYRLMDCVHSGDGARTVMAGNVEFKVGKTIANELLRAEKLAVFVCTAGKTISEKSAVFLKGDDPVLGYVYDIMGSAITEAVGDEIQQVISREVSLLGEKITNRYSPGYCHWNVADQHKLFSLFPAAPCGVTLTASALMHPVKSISGVIGIGKNVVFRHYQCDLCNMPNCVYRGK
ncbi:vitamin B12 dependent-methionine synthase activation domain-containing protein [Gaoshiqia sediminis]|uniref:AdoMet activation domain-containing protein n=1 Tax=Gaoshiqia sediminis TaxID=2986998 RepID=A0AA41Y4K5_9BACT|nr:vitamin B12 dependent-methionine synthase activation domain-containing protein [Gaoshiqia sediminis]MCW0481794.1 hypothetical protein [Gaoshiqia sediminis]